MCGSSAITSTATRTVPMVVRGELALTLEIIPVPAAPALPQGIRLTAKGGKMNYADYLIRQGERLFEGGGTRWKIYHKALVPASPIPTFTQLTLEEAKAILNQSNAHFIRWSSDPTEEPTTWWWNVCSSYDKSKLSSNTRSKIKRGTRLCTVDRVSAPWLA